MTKTHKGSCLCGAVKLEVQGEPIRVVHCHCPSCRKTSGAGFVTFVDYKLDKVSFAGPGLKAYKSSRGVKRQFCKECGSSLSFYGVNWPDEIDIFIGVFDSPEKFSPQQHCYMKTALPWAHEMDDLPKVETYSE